MIALFSTPHQQNHRNHRISRNVSSFNTRKCSSLIITCIIIPDIRFIVKTYIHPKQRRKKQIPWIAEMHLVVIAQAQLCLFFTLIFYVPNGQEPKYHTHVGLIILLSDHCPHANVHFYVNCAESDPKAHSLRFLSCVDSSVKENYCTHASQR